ncbi:unnamed protein product, partial [Adineta steineri]
YMRESSPPRDEDKPTGASNTGAFYVEEPDSDEERKSSKNQLRTKK